MRRFSSMVQFTLCTTVTVCAFLANSTPSHARSVDGILHERWTAKFTDLHLRAILDRVTDSMHLNIIMDNRVVPKRGEVYDAERDAFDGEVKAFSAIDERLDRALKRLLPPLGLDYSVEKSFIWISSPKIMRHESFEDLETRYYKVEIPTVPDLNSDLRSAPGATIDIVSLIDLAVPKIIEPESDTVLSFVLFDDVNDFLLVHHSPRNHEKN